MPALTPAARSLSRGGFNGPARNQQLTRFALQPLDGKMALSCDVQSMKDSRNLRWKRAFLPALEELHCDTSSLHSHWCL